MKQSIRPFENVFAIASLLLFSHGFYPVILGQISGQGDVDSPMLRLVYIGIYFVTLCLLTFRWQRTLVFVTGHFWLMLLIGLAMFSVSWSAVPDIAFRKVISLMGATMFGLYLGSRYDFKQQLNIYGWTSAIGLFFSIIFALALPQYGIMNTDAIVGAWQGIFPHKNGLGETMFAGFMTFYFSMQLSADRKYKLFFQALCWLSVIVVYFSESATALMSVIFIFLIAQGLKRLSITSRKSVLMVLLFLIFSCVILFLFLANFDAFLSVNEKDATLSGRTELWSTLWQFIQEKPWLGYGYGSFFSGSSREATVLWQVHSWTPVHSHNGYVQMWLNLGLIGLITFVIGYFGCLFKSLYKYLVFKDLRMLWIFLLLIYTIFSNMTEVSFLSSNNVWIITLAAIYSMKIKPQRSPAKKTIAPVA
ncbi:MAG: O-antigen ligase [Cyanobacteria bacterium P01_G01_bin.19]